MENNSESACPSLELWFNRSQVSSLVSRSTIGFVLVLVIDFKILTTLTTVPCTLYLGQKACRFAPFLSE